MTLKSARDGQAPERLHDLEEEDGVLNLKGVLLLEVVYVMRSLAEIGT